MPNYITDTVGQTYVSPFSTSPCDTGCPHRAHCLTNDNRCNRLDKWLVDNHIWQRTVETLERGTG